MEVWSFVYTASCKERGTHVGLLQAPDAGQGQMTWAESRQNYELSSDIMSYPCRHSQHSPLVSSGVCVLAQGGRNSVVRKLKGIAISAS